MSTFFKSAAMSLLSKTLQTLLYKYLSDVDVEGVNMPSLLSGGGIGMATGAGGTGSGGGRGGGDGHSGWGVRLSNVVLREGAKLLDLPGHVKRRRRRRPKPSKTKRVRMIVTKKPSPPEKGDESRVAASAGDETSSTVAKADKRSRRGRSSSSGASVASSSSHAELDDASRRTDGAVDATAPDLHGGDAETIATQSTAASTIVSASNLGISNNNATSARSSDGKSATKSSAATSTKTSSSGWFSWYGSRSGGSTAAEPSAGGVGAAPETLQEGDDEDGSGEEDDNAPATNADSEYDPLVGTMPDVPGAAAATAVGIGYDDDDDGDNQAMSDHEDDDDDGGTMILRLGKGSRIGTLDVRLIGRTLHVYVEDAFLCVEVVRVAAPPAPDKRGDGGGASAAGASSRDGEMGSASQSSANPEATASGASPKRPPPSTRKSSVSGAPTAEPEPKTTGERVLAENAIAKMLSGIPNLFLRDIRIQVILRNDMTIDPTDIDNLPALGDPLGGNDSLVDISIELLSVTDGEDFLAKFRSEASTHFDGDDDPLYSTHRANASQKLDSVHPTDLYEDLNEYLVKRIRTGRGPDGGVCVRVFPPQHDSRVVNPVDGSQWARPRWMSMTDYCLLRCSGLDIHARIFLGVRDDEADALNNSSWFATGPYEEYDVDSMLFSGVDYIVPGPQPPLPPISSNEEAALAAEGDKFWTHDGATVYRTDENGVQSSSVTSSFHRVARGLVPVISCDDHLPCEDNASSWKPLSGEARNHPLDGTTPMGGLVLNILTRDPLEINVDRSSLLVLGDMVGMFTKKVPKENPAQDYLEEASEVDKAHSIASLAGTSERSIPTRKSNHGSGPSNEMSIADDQHELVSEDIANAFPSYMRPEKIQMLGFHCSDLLFRVHVMREDGLPDAGLSYCFWDVAAKCLTIDYQTLSRVNEKSFQDLRFDVGYMTMNEYRGSECKLLMSLGLRQRVVDFDDMTIETFKTREELSDRSPWPSTAAALLEVQPPLDTLVYEERDRHAFQFRYVALGTPIADPDRCWASMNARLGPSSVDAPYDIKDQIPAVVSSVRECVFGPAAVDKPPGGSVDEMAKPSPSVKAIMKYKIQIDGGHIVLSPRLDVKMPLTVVTGERSQGLGLSFQTELDRVKIAYGEHCIEPRALESGLSLQQLVDLTDTVRLRVLLFLSDQDLEALERALCVKRESNSFLRCRSVNKGLLRAAKRHGRFRSNARDAESGGRATGKTPNRRQELMSELLKMDDDALEDLVMVHRRYHRRTSKRST